MNSKKRIDISSLFYIFYSIASIGMIYIIYLRVLVEKFTIAVIVEIILETLIFIVRISCAIAILTNHEKYELHIFITYLVLFFMLTFQLPLIAFSSEVLPTILVLVNIANSILASIINYKYYKIVYLKGTEIIIHKFGDENISLKFTDECCICLEQYEKDDQVEILPCGHNFHETCCKTWLSEKKECPLCRIPIYVKV